MAELVLFAGSFKSWCFSCSTVLPYLGCLATLPLVLEIVAAAPAHPKPDQETKILLCCFWLGRFCLFISFHVINRTALTWSRMALSVLEQSRDQLCLSRRRHASCPTSCHTETDKTALCVQGVGGRGNGVAAEKKKKKKEGAVLLGTGEADRRDCFFYMVPTQISLK